MIYKTYEFQKNLPNILKRNMILLYGENFGLKKEIKEIIISKKRGENNSIEIDSIYENEVTENEKNFYDSIYSGSLFSNEKIVIINNSTDKILEKIENIEEKKPKNLFIILLADILDKKSKLRNFFEKNDNNICMACYLDNDRDLENIIIKNFRKQNISISKEAINLLIERSNSDRGNLVNEIEKIKNYSINKKQLSTEEIKLLINFSGEYKSDALINECLCGNIREYKKILEELYTNTINQIFFLRILSNKIEKLLNMKENEEKYKNIDSLISSIKPTIFWKDKPIIKKQLSIWKLKDLKIIFNEINNIELLCKKNPDSSKIIFFNFFNEICKKANSYSLQH
tara:strand:+ start:1664 stop:2692 length:1029 start_codon:yes stop_codon:yes gene_type:complete